jgi:ketosteroid isomerase-like protein
MSDRQQIINIIEAGYAARLRGDLDGVLAAFCDDACFRLNSGPAEPALSKSVESRAALRTAMGELIDNFEFSNMKIINCIIEGQNAAVHSKMTVRAKGTGNVIETELFDLVEIRDGKIASFTQFFDTASAMAMLQPASQAPIAATA